MLRSGPSAAMASLAVNLNQHILVVSEWQTPQRKMDTDPKIIHARNRHTRMGLMLALNDEATVLGQGSLKDTSCHHLRHVAF